MMGVADKKMDHEQVKDVILYNRPTSSMPKKSVDKEKYAELADNMRLMHQYIPS